MDATQKLPQDPAKKDATQKKVSQEVAELMELIERINNREVLERHDGLRSMGGWVVILEEAAYRPAAPWESHFP